MYPTAPDVNPYANLRSQPFAISRLTIQQSGTYSPQMLRPYATTLDGYTLNQIHNRLDLIRTDKINATLVSPFTHNIIEPISTPEGEALIPYGWDTPRARFVLQIETSTNPGTPVMYIIQGYTDHYGISPYSNSIDPNLLFYINSIMGLNVATVNTPYGPKRQYRVVNADHFLYDFMSALDSNVANRIMMRPYDVQVATRLYDVENTMNDHLDASQHYTSRVGLTTTEPVSSSRDNNIPTRYVAKILESNRYAAMMSEYENSSGFFTESANRTMESIPNENPFVLKMSSDARNTVSNSFTYAALQAMDPVIDQKLYVADIQGSQFGQPHMVGQTEHWAGSDLVTVRATVLTQSIPGFMLRSLLNRLVFFCSNQNAGGEVITLITDGRSMTDIPLQELFSRFKQTFEAEMIPYVSFNGMEPFTIECNVDLFGETYIKLTIANQHGEFVAPTFCDSLVSPVITNDPNHFRQLVSDFQQIATPFQDMLTSYYPAAY